MTLKNGKKVFIQLDPNDYNVELGRFTGKYPRAAALKIANNGDTVIVLRESSRFAKQRARVHIYEGSRNLVDKPASAPSWLPSKIWKASVKKVKMIRTDVAVATEGQN